MKKFILPLLILPFTLQAEQTKFIGGSFSLSADTQIKLNGESDKFDETSSIKLNIGIERSGDNMYGGSRLSLKSITIMPDSESDFESSGAFLGASYDIIIGDSNIRPYFGGSIGLFFFETESKSFGIASDIDSWAVGYQAGLIIDIDKKFSIDLSYNVINPLDASDTILGELNYEITKFDSIDLGLMYKF
jgi:opacity protein-like surface antigen